jgi:PemK-like, MazF-like toxin of type II toxin-antitoxin system
MASWGSLLRRATTVGLDLLTRPRGTPRERPAPSGGVPRVRTAPTADRARRIGYAPDLDGAADPGEIVWTWVPYEEGDGRGKDRPLLVVGRGRGRLLGLMLSSQHTHADDPAWVPIGAGAWDRQGRASYVRLDRVLEVGEHDIRREGAVLDPQRFELVAARLRSGYGWS